jgi:hypothetical protein
MNKNKYLSRICDKELQEALILVSLLLRQAAKPLCNNLKTMLLEDECLTNPAR